MNVLDLFAMIVSGFVENARKQYVSSTTKKIWVSSKRKEF